MSLQALFKKPSYHDLVFINCPFDELYQPVFRAIVFAVYRCGFYPTSALAEENAMDNRIDKLFRLIAGCKYGIHDISRTEPDPVSHLPRFNMPFELGVFYGARRFGGRDQKNKNALVLEKTKYSYQKYLSDINGVDTRAHNNDPETAIKQVRNWLRTASGRTRIAGEQTLVHHYRHFISQLPKISIAAGFNSIDAIPFNDYCQMVEEGIRAGI